MSEYERGFFNSLLVFFFGYNLITGLFFIVDGIRATAVSDTYEIIEAQFSIVGMGLLFILSAIAGCIAYFNKSGYAVHFMFASSVINVGLMLYYGYTLLTVSPMTVIAYRYIYIAIVHFAMAVGGVSIWMKSKIE
ncbi:hypothetical protein [Macrococcus capreoli]|uniref:hypothetical protein n=1 Tax=Macrococcus capreoli TaxID=2982690 RepID=UPI003EE547B4